tara:strand:- start:22577 stop:22948 length:372 start_codon:yes stop_codon:yes gene_type:complete
MADMPSTVECACGSDAVRVIDRAPESFVANREYTFDKGNCVQGFGKDYGRSDAEQHRHYEQYFGDIKKRKRKLSSKQKDSGMEWIGGMPGEMVDSIGLHEGDPEAVLKDPKTFLKKTGLYDGD